MKIDLHNHTPLCHHAQGTPKEYVLKAEKKGAQVFIAAAGMAAHLAGVLASKTIKPIIGVPMSASALGGIDALLSTVQMPAGMPVATVALGKAGAVNSAYLAMQIFAITDKELATKIVLTYCKTSEENVYTISYDGDEVQGSPFSSRAEIKPFTIL